MPKNKLKWFSRISTESDLHLFLILVVSVLHVMSVGIRKSWKSPSNAGLRLTCPWMHSFWQHSARTISSSCWGEFVACGDFHFSTPLSKHGGLVWECRPDFLNASEKTTGFFLIQLRPLTPGPSFPNNWRCLSFSEPSHRGQMESNFERFLQHAARVILPWERTFTPTNVFSLLLLVFQIFSCHLLKCSSTFAFPSSWKYKWVLFHTFKAEAETGNFFSPNFSSSLCGCVYNCFNCFFFLHAPTLMTPDFVWHAANGHTLTHAHTNHTHGSVVCPRTTHFHNSFYFVVMRREGSFNWCC